MIGRQGEVKHFDVVRWAREMVAEHRLRTLEAHVLLLLASYANSDAIAWPSIKTLAIQSGLRPTRDGRNSAVSAALSRLEELRLIWTTQAGSGHPAKRELLYNPTVIEAARPEGRIKGHQPPLMNALPSTLEEGSAGQRAGAACRSREASATGGDAQVDESREAVREEIARSLSPRAVA